MFDVYFLKLCWLLIVKFCSQSINHLVNQSIPPSFCLEHLTNTFEEDGSWCESCVTAQWHLHGWSKPPQSKPAACNSYNQYKQNRLCKLLKLLLFFIDWFCTFLEGFSWFEWSYEGSLRNIHLHCYILHDGLWQSLVIRGIFLFKWRRQHSFKKWFCSSDLSSLIRQNR